MASFDPARDLHQDLGYRLLMNSAVSLFYRAEVLSSNTEWLAGAGYQIIELDASAWDEFDALHEQLASAFDFPGYYGRNFDALRDCLRDVVEQDYGWRPEATGLVVVIRHYDAFVSAHPVDAQVLVDILADASRGALLLGRRLLCLVQSDDPRLSLAPVGATRVMWNAAEWLDRDRLRDSSP